MWQLIGLVGVFVTIGVGYTIAGGHFGVIIEAVGPELLVILGPGAMTLLISNEMSTVKSVLGGFKKVVSGPCWRRSDYADALCLLFLLFRITSASTNASLVGVGPTACNAATIASALDMPLKFSVCNRMSGKYFPTRSAYSFIAALSIGALRNALV
jgi:hypothetical protein